MDNLTKKQILDRFIDNLKENKYSEITINTYKNIMKKILDYVYIRKRRMEIEINTLTQKQITKMINNIGNTASYRKQISSALKRFYKWLEISFGESVPRFEIETPRNSFEMQPVTTDKEIKKFKNAIEEAYTIENAKLRAKALVYLTACTAMREVEIKRCKVDDIDFDTGMILVRGKGAKERLLPLEKECLEILSEYLKEVHKGKSEYLFYSNTTYNKIKHGTIGYMFNKIKEQAGIEKPITPHSIRRWKATSMRKDGIQLSHISKFLGHSGEAVTARYINIDVKEINDTLKEMYPDRY